MAVEGCSHKLARREPGLIIAAAGLALAPVGSRSAVLIERDGATAALRSKRGNLVFPPATAATYRVENWLLADGDDGDAEIVSEDRAFNCDPLGCIGRVKGKIVALVRRPDAPEEDCRTAAIVITPFTIGKGCRPARDRRMLEAQGAHALYIEGL